jgi:predicted Rossmann-fold nucleotide-binding protein
MRQIAVIGAGGCAQDSELAQLAEEVGRRLAEAGVTLVCGGREGVMEASGIGHARNLAVVGSGEVVIAVGGEWGTLSEIGHARALGRTVVALRSWELIGRERMQDAPGVVPAETAEQAAAAALGAL